LAYDRFLHGLIDGYGRPGFQYHCAFDCVGNLDGCFGLKMVSKSLPTTSRLEKDKLEFLLSNAP
jgi:hypothetical protein